MAKSITKKFFMEILILKYMILGAY